MPSTTTIYLSLSTIFARFNFLVVKLLWQEAECLRITAILRQHALKLCFEICFCKVIKCLLHLVHFGSLYNLQRRSIRCDLFLGRSQMCSMVLTTSNEIIQFSPFNTSDHIEIVALMKAHETFIPVSESKCVNAPAKNFGRTFSSTAINWRICSLIPTIK